MCYLGRGENEQEITTLCLLLKEKLAKDPISIVTDYKPAWDRGIRRVFPDTLLIRDGFHTVQLINQAIFKELKAISKDLFAKPIRAIKRLYQAIKKDKWQGTELTLVPEHAIAQEFQYFYTLLIKLYITDALQDFIQELKSVMEVLEKLGTNSAQLLAKELRRRLPKNGLTQENMKYYQKKLTGAFSLLIRTVRHQLEHEKKEFISMQYTLLKREENSSLPESEALNAFFKKFPDFKKYRALSLRISNIYHVPPGLLTRSIILNIKLWEDAGEPLVAAVNTLKKNVQEILNFTRMVPKKGQKELMKKVRTGPEPMMRKIKDIVRNKFGLRTPEMAQYYLESQLSCQVIVNQGQKCQIAM